MLLVITYYSLLYVLQNIVLVGLVVVVDGWC